MRKVFCRSAYNYDGDEVSRATALVCCDESKTIQSAKDDCDINIIMKRFGVSGVAPQNVRTPMYGDFVGAFDYQTAMNAVIEAEHSFMSMPAAVRARFNNDPHLFVEFCCNEKNIEELRRMGLAVNKAAEGPSSSSEVPASSPSK